MHGDVQDGVMARLTLLGWVGYVCMIMHTNIWIDICVVMCMGMYTNIRIDMRIEI